MTEITTRNFHAIEGPGGLCACGVRANGAVVSSPSGDPLMSSDPHVGLQRAIAQNSGRLATGDPSRSLIEDVKVSCRRCGGVTVFPVLKDGGVRPCPAPCLHCGEEI